MILFVDETNRIYACNKVKPKEEVENLQDAIWYDGEFDFFIGEDIEGKGKNFFYENGEIRIEYFDLPSDYPVEPEPIPDPVMEKLDSIEAKIQTNEELQTFYDDIVKEVGL